MERIPDRWYVIAASGEVGRRPVRLERFGEHLALWRRADGSVACVADVCPHRGASLAQGRLVEDCIECPFHGFRFAADGTCTHIPAQGDEAPRGFDVQAHTICEAHGFLWLFTGEGTEEAGAPPWFAALDGYSAAGSELTSEWDCHYTRAIENQLDFAHLAHVHRRSIGRMIDEEVDVACEVDGDRIRVWNTLDGEDGTYVELRGPNVWVNKIGPSFGFLAFVPVNEHRTRYYVRFYQRFVTMPGLSWLAGWASRFANGWILGEDQAVVEGQRPDKAELFMGEKLHRSDAGIIAYRKWRHRLLHPPDAAAREQTG